ncbi:hypothetical protein BGZ46_004605 [Entomortierella lignicola]|nr:hypothetical protein BGZ46_004605 [Entomortierella lignicola]
MNALAAYGSDSEDSGSESAPVSSTATRAQAKTSVSGSTSGASSKISSLSSMLPPPKSSQNLNTTTTIKKTSTPTASISSIPKTSIYHTLPTLEPDSDSEEEESEFRKKAKLNEAAKNASGVGALFAMLPAPKSSGTGASSSSSTSGTGKTTPAKPSFMPRTVKKPTAVTKKPVVAAPEEEKEDDDDDDDEEPVSFFPLGPAVTATPTPSTTGKTASNSYIPLYFDKKPLTTEEQQAQNQELVDVSASNEQYAYPTNDQYSYNEQYAYPTNDQYAYATNDQYSYQTNDAYNAYDANSAYVSQTEAAGSSGNTMSIDDAGMKKLGMRKARDGPINVIDVSARDQISHAQHARLSMAGGADQAKPVDLASIQHLKPTTGQKRKHNILSLAYQAKANQQQLNASWASSRQTKAETQSKYGF